MFKKVVLDISKKNIFVLFILFSVLLYSPLIFFAFINEIARISFFAFIAIGLFINLFFYRYSYKKIYFIIVTFNLLLIYLSSTLLTNTSPGAIRTALGYFLILLFSTLFYMTIINDETFKENILYKYVIFFKIVCISIIINFILNIFFTSFNILTPYFPNYFNYSYNASPFGLSISKYILGINISRNFFFFIEPVYTAPFLLINIFVIGPALNIKNKSFIIFNFIAGMFTFSFLFFVGFFFIYLVRNWPKLFLILLIFILTIIMKIPIVDDNSFIASSSTTDRLSRIQIAFDLLSTFSLKQLISGSGYIFTQGLERGISAGLFSSFIEGGLIGLIIPLFFGLIYCKKNVTLISILILSLITIEPFKMPLFWVSLVIAGSITRMNLQNES